MDNGYTSELNNMYNKETALNAKVEESQENAVRAISELHQALLDLNAVKTQEKAILVDLNEFIQRIQQHVIKVDVSKVSAKKNEILGLIENISWSVSKLLDLTNEVEQEISRQND